MIRKPLALRMNIKQFLLIHTTIYREHFSAAGDSKMARSTGIGRLLVTVILAKISGVCLRRGGPKGGARENSKGNRNLSSIMNK